MVQTDTNEPQAETEVTYKDVSASAVSLDTDPCNFSDVSFEAPWFLDQGEAIDPKSFTYNQGSALSVSPPDDLLEVEVAVHSTQHQIKIKVSK